MGLFMELKAIEAYKVEGDSETFKEMMFRETGLKPVDLSEGEKTEMLLAIHFPAGKYRCSHCVDHIDGLCPGEGFKGYKAVKRCMAGKAKSREMQIYF